MAQVVKSITHQRNASNTEPKVWQDIGNQFKFWASSLVDDFATRAEGVNDSGDRR